MNIVTFSRLLLLSSLVLSALACSGGGGGGSEGGNTGGRTRDTAIRIIHGALDTSPLTVRIGELDVQTARFAEVTNFVRINSGSRVTLLVNRARSVGETFASLVSDIVDGNEYSLFVYGSALEGTQKFALIEEPLQQPDSGFARIRLIHAIEGNLGISIDSGDIKLGVSELGEVGAFVDVEMGSKIFQVQASNGSPLGTLPVELGDREEVTIVVTGSISLGVVYFRVYRDRD